MLRFAMDDVGGYTEHSLVFSFIEARKRCGGYNRFGIYRTASAWRYWDVKDSAGMVFEL